MEDNANVGDESASHTSDGKCRQVVSAPRARYLAVLVVSVIGLSAIIWGVIRVTSSKELPFVPGEIEPSKNPNRHLASVGVSAPSLPRQPTIYLPLVKVDASAEQLQSEAERVADELVTRYPHLPESLHVAAVMNVRRRRSGEAAKLWRKCIELSSKHEPYYVQLAAIEMDRGNDELAVATLRQAIHNGCNSPDLKYHLAMASMKLGQVEEAERAAQGIVLEVPQFPPFWLVLGQVQLEQGKLAEAEASLRKALEMDTQSSDACFELANACARQGKHDDAVKYREQFSQLEAMRRAETPQQFQILWTAEARKSAVIILGEAAAVYSWLGESREAERLLMRAIAIDPTSIESCRNLADFYHRAEMHAEERVVRRRLIEIDPQNSANYVDVANESMLLGEPEAAEAALKLVIAVTPEAAIGYGALAKFYLDAGNAKEARWFAQEAVRREPSVVGYELLASICLKIGDDVGAESALELARRIKTK